MRTMSNKTTAKRKIILEIIPNTSCTQKQIQPPNRRTLAICSTAGGKEEGESDEFDILTKFLG